MYIFLPFAFLFGACVGSFLNVLIIRLENAENAGPSFPRNISGLNFLPRYVLQ